MTDLKLDNLTGDLDLSTKGLHFVDGREAIRQQLSLRLSIGVGEWMLDQTVFVPWRQKILVRNPDLRALSSLFRSLILSTPEVTGLRTFNLFFNNVTGLFSLEFVCLTAEEPVAFTATADDIESLASVLLLEAVGSIV